MAALTAQAKEADALRSELEAARGGAAAEADGLAREVTACFWCFFLFLNTCFHSFALGWWDMVVYECIKVRAAHSLLIHSFIAAAPSVVHP